MAFTLTQLQTRCARDFGEPAQQRVTAAAWQDYLNDTITDFCVKTMCRREWVGFVPAQDTPAGTTPNAEYVPANGVLVDRVEYLQTSSYPLEHKHIFEAVGYDIRWYLNTGTPVYYLFGDYRMQTDNRQQVLFMYPVPVAPLTDLNGVIIRTPVLLSAAGDTAEIPEVYQRALVYGALALAFDAQTELRDRVKAQLWQARYEELVMACKGDADARFTNYPASGVSTYY